MKLGRVIRLLNCSYIAILVAAFPGPVLARGYAVIVANADYDGDKKLTDAVNPAPDPARRFMPDLAISRQDQNEIQSKLTEMGYEVELFSDADASAMNQAVRRFNKLSHFAKASEPVIFYYTGHSVQVEEMLYLIPTKAAILKVIKDGVGGPAYVHRDDATKGLVPLSAIDPADRAPATGINLIIIDSCRDNPWPELAGRGVVDTSPHPGTVTNFAMRYLASVGTGYPKRNGSTVVVDAAAPGSEATGVNDDSPFTAALVGHLAEAKPLIDIFEDAARETRATTEDFQKPQIYRDPMSNPCLGDCANKPLPAADTSLTRFANANDKIWAALGDANLGVSVAQQARKIAGPLWTQKATEIEVGPPAFETMPPTKPAPMPVLSGPRHAFFYNYEIQDIDFAGDFVKGKREGVGVVYYDCEAVMLRARCPLNPLNSYYGAFAGNEPRGAGVAFDWKDGSSEAGKFVLARGPFGEEGVSLVSGEKFLPDGTRFIGIFKKDQLAIGVRWDPIDAHWVRLVSALH